MALTYTALATTTVGSGGAGSIDFQNIPQTYTDLCILLSLRSANSGGSGGMDDWYLRVNNVSTGGTYSNRGIYGTGSSIATWNGTGGTSGAQIYGGWNNEALETNTFTNLQIYFANYANTSYNKSLSWEGVQEYNRTTAYSYMGAGLYSSNNAISRVTVTSWNSTWQQYTTATLYGIKNTV
jgi:hypothetical protein